MSTTDRPEPDRTETTGAPKSSASGRVFTTWTDSSAPLGRIYPEIRTESPGALRRFALSVRRMLTGPQ